MIGRPALVAVSETFLDQSVEAVSLAGYVLVSRSDRSDGREGGGILLFATAEASKHPIC